MRSSFIVSLLLALFITIPLQAKTIELGETVIIESKAVAQWLVENDKLIRVKRVEKGLSIRTIQRGRTYLYIWDQAGLLNLVPIKIVPKGYNELLTIQEKLLKKRIDKKGNIKTQLRFLMGGSEQGIYKSSWNVSQLSLFGKTNVGQFHSFFQFEQRDSLNQFVMGFAQLHHRLYSVSVGDGWAQISPLTAAYMRYQGAHLYNLNIMGLKMDIIGGATGQSLWGGDIWRNAPIHKRFVGTKILTSPLKNINVFATAFGVQSRNAITNSDPYLLASLGGRYLGKPLTLDGEFATELGGQKAAFGHLNYQYQAYSLDSNLRLIESGFESLTNTSAQTSYQGLRNTLSYQFRKYLKLYGNYNAYQRPDLVANAIIYERGLGVNFNHSKYLPKIDFSYSELDKSAYPRGGIYRGYRIHGSQHLVFIPSWLYGTYRPHEFINPNSSSLNEDTDQLIGGISTELFGYHTLSFEGALDNVFRTIQVPEQLYTLQLQSTTLPKLTMGPVLIGVQYNTKLNLHYKHRIRDYTQIFAQTKITFNQDWVDECYLSYTKSVKLSSNGNDYNDQYSFGIQTLFDTGLNLAPTYYEVTGYVFEDSNKNGKRDNGEKGLSGFKVTNGKNNTFTSGDGHYYMQLQKNPFLQFSSNQYAFFQINVSNPYQVRFRPHQRSIKLDIPVSFVKTITAIAYYDANNNGKYDKRYDQLISNTKFFLMDGTIAKQTIRSKTGKANIELPASAADLSLSIDLTSIPKELVPVDPAFMTQDLTSALESTNTLYFPFVFK